MRTDCVVRIGFVFISNVRFETIKKIAQGERETQEKLNAKLYIFAFISDLPSDIAIILPFFILNMTLRTHLFISLNIHCCRWFLHMIQK